MTLIAENPNARSKFFIEDIYEAGIVLKGTEIKSLRKQSPSLRDAYVQVTGNPMEAFLYNAHIAPYSHGNIWNHDPLRKRKLLLNKSELSKLYGATTKKGLTIVPIKMYFHKGYAKVQIGLGKGKKMGDKRDSVKKRQADREMERALKK